MIRFSNLDEFACLKGSEQLIEKIEETLTFIHEKGFSIDIEPCGLYVEKDTLTAKLSLSFPFQPALSHSLLSSRLSSQQTPHSPKGFLNTFSDSLSS